MVAPALTPFIGYEPNPQGPGYFFQHNNGQKYLSYGPAADQLRAQIDASKPMAPQPIALGAPPPVDAGVPDTGPAPIMAPPPQAAPNPPPAQVAPPEPQRTGTTTVEHVEPKAPVPEPPVNEPPGKVVPPSGQLPVMRGAPAPTEAATHPSPPIPQPGFVYTPGRNPAREAKNAVAVPKAQSIVTEGGIQDPAARQAQVDAFHAQVEAQKNLAEVQKNAAASQLETERANLLEAQKRQQDAETEISNQEARKATIRKEFDNRMAIAQKDYDISSRKEVDQYRLFKGGTGGTVNGILATLGVALGTVGSALGRGVPNYALQILNRTMDNDIDAQRDEIHRGVAKSSNDLKRISDQYNVDYDDAASILKMNYARRAEAELAKKAAMNGTQQAQVAFAQVQPAFQKWQADAAAELNASLNGKVKMVQESKMVTPSAGGVRPESAAEYSKRLAQAAQDEKNKNAIAHGGIAQKEEEGGPGKLPARMASMQAINRSAQEDVINFLKADPGGFIAPMAKDSKAYGLLSTKAREDLDSKARAISGKLVAATNGQVNQAELHEFDEALRSPYEHVRKQAAKDILQAAKAVDMELEAQRGKAAEGVTVDTGGSSGGGHE